ncbi:MAG: Gmad2 immunoglobulin-like domain-containing protein [Candidatus Uhrbacteria bacterium]|nr:Gmad2 immunoglobulin-like domain-containing protein [Candidatus Uhrbacteria bacterium]
MLKHPHHHFSIPVFFLIIAFVVGGLMLVWSQLPAPQARVGWLSWLPAPIASNAPTSTPVSSEASIPLKPTQEPLPTNLRGTPHGMICGEGNLICVDQGYQNILLTNPLVVTGTARVFENQFSWSLFDDKGHAFEKGNLMAKGPDPDADQPSTFELRSFFTSVPSSATGSLMLFEFSARDGEVVSKLVIPVRFSTKTTVVQLWMPSDWEAWRSAVTKEINGDAPTPSPAEWLKLQSVITMETRFPIQATLAVLLFRLKQETRLDAELDLMNFAFKQGTAFVELGMDQNGWAGVSYVRAMVDPVIEMTLLKFPGVTKVVRGPLPVK